MKQGTYLAKLLSENIKRIRNEKKITQKDFAESCGISSVHLSRIENASTWPAAELIEVMAEKLGVKPFELFYTKEESNLMTQDEIEKLLKDSALVAANSFNKNENNEKTDSSVEYNISHK
jgi:transcriptional regulator with XRE-family HTH domain